MMVGTNVRSRGGH